MHANEQHCLSQINSYITVIQAAREDNLAGANLLLHKRQQAVAEQQAGLWAALQESKDL